MRSHSGSGSLRDRVAAGIVVRDDVARARRRPSRSRGTFVTTTEPAPMRALSPISTAPMSFAPAPTVTRLPSVGWRFVRCMLVPPSVTPCRMWQSSPISAVSPMTTPMPWSMNSPSPICAPGWISMPVTKRLKFEMTRGSTGTPRRCSAWASAVHLAGVEARVGEDDLERAAGGGIALADRVDVALDGLEYRHEDDVLLAGSGSCCRL